jgi:hypothetical protein
VVVEETMLEQKGRVFGRSRGRVNRRRTRVGYDRELVEFGSARADVARARLYGLGRER